MAARLEGVDAAAVTVDRGEVRIGERALTPSSTSLTRGLGRLGGEVIGVGEMRKEARARASARRHGRVLRVQLHGRRGAVDRETGDVTVERHVTASDVGRALNPGQVRGQDEGAAVMGLGHTLMEHYMFDDEGRIRNLGAIDYRIPTSMDLPSMASEIVENGDGPGPYGAKGMSEGALLCVAPAVAAAVADATGVVIRDLPLSPERVWQALQDDEREREAVRRTYAARPRRSTSTREASCALVGGKAANLARCWPDLGLPVPPGFVDHHRDLPRVPGDRLARRPRRRAARRGWPRSRRRSGGGSATRRIRCSSASGRARRCRCPG